MGWLGQHIWDYISRFRNDVYLEELTESKKGHTIGIDTDGKLYKHDTVTWGLPNEVITGGASNLVSNNNLRFVDSNKTLYLGAYNNGDNGFTITRSAELPTDIDGDGINSGTHGDFSIKGAFPLTPNSTENMTGGALNLYGSGSSGQGLGGNIDFYTAYQAYASPSNLAQRKTDATQVLNARITNSGELQAKKFTQVYHAGGLWPQGNSALHYFSFTNGQINTSLTQQGAYNCLIAPYDGYVDFVVVRSTNTPGNTDIGFHRSSTGTQDIPEDADVTTTINMTTDDTPYKAVFNTATFTAGQIIGISMDPTNEPQAVNITMVIKYDLFNSI